MIIIDITGEKFDFLDCSESNIFFERFSEGETFKFKIWGVTLMHELGISEKSPILLQYLIWCLRMLRILL